VERGVARTALCVDVMEGAPRRVDGIVTYTAIMPRAAPPPKAPKGAPPGSSLSNRPKCPAYLNRDSSLVDCKI
jgi:hypothetical protein